MDRASLGVVVVYVCQIEGRPLIKEVVSTIRKKMQGDAKRKDIKFAIESAQKKGLLSINYDEDNNVRYSVKDIRWAKPPEIAHLKTLLPVLLETPEAKKIAQMFEGMEIDDKEHKKPRLPDIRDYCFMQVDVELVTPMLGGQSGGDANNVLKFRRLGGKVWLPLNLWLKSALKLRLRQLNITESKTKYIVADDVMMNNNVVDKEIEVLNQIVNGRGVPKSKHERIPEGTKFTITLSFPTTNGVSVKDMVWCLNGVHLGSKHKEFGRLAVLNHRKVDRI